MGQYRYIYRHTGPKKATEGFAIQVTPKYADKYDVYYMAHLQGTADTPWFRNGEFWCIVVKVVEWRLLQCSLLINKLYLFLADERRSAISKVAFF